MTGILKISEATSLALHAMAIAAEKPQAILSAEKIAKSLGASEFHLSKVLMQLTHAGFLKAFRGPNGGYCLARPANKIRLIEIYELIEGRFIEENCLLGRAFCPRDDCILGGLVEKINSEVKDYLMGTKLSDVTELSQRGKK